MVSDRHQHLRGKNENEVDSHLFYFDIPEGP